MPEPVPVPAHAPIRILVADDTAHVRRVVCDMLELDGFEVVGEAADGEQAVALTLDLNPHVVVMDLHMPLLDGIEATRRIRAERPHQQVVLYTAYLDAAAEKAASEAGVALCLSKVDGLSRLGRELSRLTQSGARRPQGDR